MTHPGRAHNRGSNANAPGASASPYGEMPEDALLFKIFVLGGAGAGKTVFLASLYKQILVQNDRLGYFAKLGRQEHADLLLRTYSRMENPALPWPAGNVKVTEFEFHCFRQCPTGPPIPLFRIRYHDFPGGFLYEKIDDSFDLHAAARDADSLLVLIDGEKVLRSMRGIAHDGPSLNQDLDAISAVLMSNINKPMHFAITKWDVLHGEPLARVREELFRNKTFADLIAQCRNKPADLHLVPVSAVGDNFAVYDVEAGRSRKLPRGTLAPYNVELSIGFTVADHLNRAAELLKGQQHRLGGFILTIMQTLHVSVLSAIKAERVLGPAYREYFPVHVNLEPIMRILRYLDSTLQEGASSREKKLEKLARDLDNKRTALDAIFTLQMMNVTDFVDAYRESDLRKAYP